MERLKAAVKEAELVLVGIGEEMDTPLSALTETQPYAGLAEEIGRKEETGWMIPWLFSHYLTHVEDRRRRQAYSNLAGLLEGKNYFIVTTCMDGRIEDTSLDTGRITAPCGSYRKLQCRKGCRNSYRDASDVVDQFWKECEGMAGRLERLNKPVCAECKELCFLHYIQEGYQEEGYLPQWEVYTKWLQGTLHKKLCVLELGVGLKYPTVIRWPFEKAAYFNQKADFFRIHHNLYQMSEQLADKGVSIPENSLDFLENKL